MILGVKSNILDLHLQMHIKALDKSNNALLSKRRKKIEEIAAAAAQNN